MTKGWEGSPRSGQKITPPKEWLTPFLTTTEPAALAGSILRIGGRSEAWCLPDDVGDPVPWVRAAVRTWHLTRPFRYPNDPGWPSNEKWMTLRELELRGLLADLTAERASFISESEKREAGLRSELAYRQRS